MGKKILILCTGNSCRSQMAHGFLQSLDPELRVFSGGTHPAAEVNRYAVQVMKEIGIDISHHQPCHVESYLNEPFDWVITVCDNAKESCPVFTGRVANRIHIGFEDPADAVGTDEEVLRVYRDTRDQIREAFRLFYHELTGKKE